MKETPSNYNKIGMTLGERGKYRAAVEAFQKAIDLKWDFAPAHHNLGVALSNLGRHDEAIESFRSALAVDPRNVASHCGLGRELGLLGKHDEALAALEEAALRIPDSHEVIYRCGVAYENMMLLGRAEAEYRRAIELNPFLSEPYLSLARLLLYALDRPDDAIACLTVAMELDPNGVSVRRALNDALKHVVR